MGMLFRNIWFSKQKTERPLKLNIKPLLCVSVHNTLFYGTECPWNYMHIINFTLCSRHPFICEKHLICDWVWIAICRFPLPPSKNLTDVKIPVPLQPPWTTFYPPVQVFPQNPLLTICLPPKFLLHRYCTRKKKWNNCKNIILCLYVL